MSRRRFDAVVAGGAVVGAAAALALARAGWRVALVEAREPELWRADTPDLRVFAIAPASARLLDSLGAWEPILRARAQPYRDMRVWDAGGGGELRFAAADLGQAALGHIVEQLLLQDRLWRACAAESGIERFTPATVVAIEELEDAVRVELDDGGSLRGGLLLACDGASSRVRGLAGIEVAAHDYSQRGLVAFVRTARPHRETAWQRFLPGGPLAFLPFTDGLCSIVWSLPEAEAGRLLDCEAPDFERELERAFESRLGAVGLASQRAAFPLRRQLAGQYVRGRVVLLGDAAHVVHPLAGQGVNLGLGDVAMLLEVLGGEGLPQGEALARALRRFERARRSENALAAYAFEGLNRLFSNDAVLPTLLRGPALGLVDRIAPLKRLFATRAAGWC